MTALELQIIGIALAGIGLFGGFKWFEHQQRDIGRAEVQAKWDAQKATDRVAIDNANIAAQAAAELYEEAKAKQQIKVVTVTREVSRALEAAPEWGSAALPARVRDAVAAAASAIDPAQPDGALRVPAPGGADELATGASLPRSPAVPGGMLPAASGPR